MPLSIGMIELISWEPCRYFSDHPEANGMMVTSMIIAARVGEHSEVE